MIGLFVFCLQLGSALSDCIYRYSYAYSSTYTYCSDSYNYYNSYVSTSVLSVGAIVGIVIGSLVGVAILISVCVGVACCFLRKQSGNPGHVITGQPMVSCDVSSNQSAIATTYPQPYVNSNYTPDQPYQVQPPAYTPGPSNGVIQDSTQINMAHATGQPFKPTGPC